MQNSGLGNAVNPLLSLCDVEVYSIPLLLAIGWRGKPGENDEPQHVKQGAIQLDLLKTLDIPYEIISGQDEEYESKISSIIDLAKKESRAVALLIKKNTFEEYNSNDNSDIYFGNMKREEALKIILKKLNERIVIVSTTGKTSREIFEIREQNNESHSQEFLTVGSMGHCTSIALGIALSKPDREVLAIDGDGAFLMHMGSLTNVGSIKPKNFRHILINNQIHESVGGQSTAAKHINLSEIIKGIGGSKLFRARTSEELANEIEKFLSCEGPSFLEVIVAPGSRSDLGRPTIKPIDNKLNFMDFLDK